MSEDREKEEKDTKRRKGKQSKKQQIEIITTYCESHPPSPSLIFSGNNSNCNEFQIKLDLGVEVRVRVRVSGFRSRMGSVPLGSRWIDERLPDRHQWCQRRRGGR